MDAVDQLKQEVREGRIGVDRLVDLVVTSKRQLQAASQCIAELEKQSGGPMATKPEQPFSLRAEEQRQQSRRNNKKRKKKNKGRRGGASTGDEIAQA
jgi:hypothetical protein